MTWNNQSDTSSGWIDPILIPDRYQVSVGQPIGMLLTITTTSFTFDIQTETSTTWTVANEINTDWS